MSDSEWDVLGTVADGVLPEVGDVLVRGFGRYRVEGVRLVDGVREVRAGRRWLGELAPGVQVWRHACERLGCARG